MLKVYFGKNGSYPDAETLLNTYTYTFYWSTLTLAMMGDVPHPTTVFEYIFVVIEFLVAVLVFATIIGNVGNIISSMNAERTEFQEKMDRVKRYMVLRKVHKNLEQRVIRSVQFDSFVTSKTVELYSAVWSAVRRHELSYWVASAKKNEKC